MTAKLQWYREKGYRSVEEGGRLAVTIYQNDEQFFMSVLKLIELLKTGKIYLFRRLNIGLHS